jgi:apolipoprotein N-acyltransferase
MPTQFNQVWYWLSQRSFGRSIAALILGSLAVLGFSPYDFPLATMVALIGLWGLWSTASNWQEGRNLGALFGLGFFGFGVSWLGLSLGLYGGVPWGIAWLVVVLFILLLASFIALVGALSVYWRDCLPLLWWSILLLPSLWVLAEWLRIIIWTGFPWLLIGYSHTDTWLAGWAPISGTLGLSFAVAMSAGLVWWMARTDNWISGALIYGIFWGLSGQLAQVSWVEAKGDAQTIGLVHGQVSERIKWESSALDAIIMAYEQASLPLVDKAKIIVWPETAIPTFLDKALPKMALFIEQLHVHQTQVVTGVALREDKVSGRQYFNSIASLDGSVRFDKRHLVPFSEFYPGYALLDWFARKLDMPMAQFSFGETPVVQPLSTAFVAMGVCYEADFGTEMARSSAHADWWLIVSDDGWFYPSSMASQHWQMIRLRAKELGRDIVRVTNQGYSGVATVKGDAMPVASPDSPHEGHLVNVQAYQGETPYVRWHDMPLLGLLSFVLAMVIMINRRLRQSGSN